MTRVVCMVQKGAEITAEVCVAAQVDERCFCMKALTALQALGDGDGMTLRDRSNLVTLRSRAAGMYRQPPERRYAGPALRVFNKEVADDALPAVEPVAAGPEAPAVTGPVDVQRCCASDDCFKRIGNKSPHAKCHGCRERDLRRSAAKPRFCKADGCTTQLRAPNMNDFCSICMKRRERLGVPMGEPSKETAVVTPVEVKTFPGLVDAVVEKLRWVPPADSNEYRLVGDPPDPKTLGHDYLLACVQEARRRLIQLDEHFTILTTKEQ